MAKLKNIAIKFGSGFLGGFSTGGWAGGFTGGTVAAATGGKAKPLKSMAIGAGSGFVGGYAARSLNLQNDTTRIGNYSFRPLSSKAFNYMNPAKEPQYWSDVTGVKGGPMSSNKPSPFDALLTAAPALIAGGGEMPIDYSPMMTSDGFPGYTGGGEGGFGPQPGGQESDWMPLVLLGGAVLLLGGA